MQGTADWAIIVYRPCNSITHLIQSVEVLLAFQASQIKETEKLPSSHIELDYVLIENMPSVLPLDRPWHEEKKPTTQNDFQLVTHPNTVLTLPNRRVWMGLTDN